MEADSGFLALAKISAFSRPGIRAGLRWLLLIKLLVIFFLMQIYRHGSSKFFLKKFVKNVTLFIFLSILYMQVKERTNRAGRIGESGDCSFWILAYITGIFLRWRLPDVAICGGTAGKTQT